MPSEQTRYFSTHRVEGYTDAVFAIAVTLLVLDLTTSAIGEVSSDDAMWASLTSMWESFLAFFVSFLLLSLLWVIHLRQWRDIQRVDWVLLWLNNARLLFIVLIPFTTSLVADYSEFYAGRILLPVNFFFAALLGYLSYVWAASNNRHLVGEETLAEERSQNLGGLSAVISGAIAVVLSPWLGSWAFLAYALNGPIEALLSRRSRTRRREADQPRETR